MAALGWVGRVPRVGLVRRLLRHRRLAVLVGVGLLALFGTALWAYLTPGTTAGTGGQAGAGFVEQVTGLQLGAGGVTPTANANVPLQWTGTTLSTGGALSGYLVNRYDGSNNLQTTGAACSGTVSGTICTENNVPDGTWKYGVQGKFHNWLGQESSQITVKVDTSAPSITSKPQTPSANTTPTFAFSHPTYSSFKCRLDAAASFTSCTSPDTLSALADGSHTFRVEAIDASGNPTQAASYTWTVDSSAPSITSKPSSPSANSNPSFSFTDTSYSSFKCKEDGGPFTTCTSPQAYSNLADGSQNFRVEAIDADGIATSFASYTWTINTTAPSITAKPASTSANSSPSFSFNHSVYTTFKCKLDGAASFTACTSPQSYSSLADGSHTFTVEAVDSDGFVDPTTASYTWTINTSAPSITAKPQSPSANATPSFSFSHSVGTYSFKCKVDAGSFATCSSPDTLSTLASGSHNFTVEAVDSAGFADPNTAAYTWTVDTSAPSITSKPQTPSANASPSFSFTHANYSSFKCQLDGGGFSACSSPKSYSSLSNAAHTFQVEATDADGIATSVASYSWTVDTSAPTISAKPAATSASTGPSFSFTHANYSTFQCQLDGGGFSSCTSPKVYSSLATGSHTFQVKAVDADGVATQVSSYTWTINTTIPSITAKPSSPSANAGPSFSFSHGVYTSFQCQIDGGGFSSCTSPKTYSSLSNASHTFQVEALDANGVATGPASSTWTVDATAPSITALPNNPTNSTSASFSFNHTESTYTFKCKLDAGSFTVCTSPQSYAGPLAQGSHTFTVEAIDSDNFVDPNTAAFTWTVDTTPPTVTLTQVNGSGSLTTTNVVTSIGGACGTATGDIATVNWSITSGASESGSTSCTSGSWTATLPTPLTTTGNYTASATQSDTAGNTGSTGNQTITINNATVTKSAAGTYTLTVPAHVTSFTFTLNGAGGGGGTGGAGGKVTGTISVPDSSTATTLTVVVGAAGGAGSGNTAGSGGSGCASGGSGGGKQDGGSVGAGGGGSTCVYITSVSSPIAVAGGGGGGVGATGGTGGLGSGTSSGGNGSPTATGGGGASGSTGGSGGSGTGGGTNGTAGTSSGGTGGTGGSGKADGGGGGGGGYGSGGGGGGDIGGSGAGGGGGGSGYSGGSGSFNISGASGTVGGGSSHDTAGSVSFTGVGLTLA